MSASRVPPHALDALDNHILTLLVQNARQSAETIGNEIGLSPSAVRRRIVRLEESGVIEQYTTVVQNARPKIEAYVEVDLMNGADAAAFLRKAVARSEVREGALLAGRPDAILRLRAETHEKLADVVRRLRMLDEVSTTKTLIALATVGGGLSRPARST